MSASSEERERWNHRYRDNPEGWLDPDSFLAQAFTEFVQPQYPRGGNVLDLAGGAGRHSIWMAKQGWKVTLIDISETGVEQAKKNAGPLASHIEVVVDDLTEFRASQTQFDVVMVFFFLNRGIFEEIVKTIRPGGLLLYKTYTREQLKRPGGPKDPLHLLSSGELLRLAGGLQVLHYREALAEKATAEIVARKESPK
jgi:2-polyprenyl-3-methyl-5-hydroxy-6-metoxy-1,4-benzoquinol methylase